MDNHDLVRTVHAEAVLGVEMEIGFEEVDLDCSVMKVDT